MNLKSGLLCMALLALSGCASQQTASPRQEALNCPANEYVVCRGGTVSRIGNSDRRDPRICTCEPSN